MTQKERAQVAEKARADAKEYFKNRTACIQPVSRK